MTDPTTPPEGTIEGSGTPIDVILPRQSGDTSDTTTPPSGVILIPPLGLDRVAKLTEGFKEWWKKHGPNSTQAVIDAIAIFAEALKPAQPQSPPAQPATPTP
jgi:hypothetical protein